jgi:hypothetical protein
MDAMANFDGVEHAVDYMYNFITLSSGEEELELVLTALYIYILFALDRISPLQSTSIIVCSIEFLF